MLPDHLADTNSMNNFFIDSTRNVPNPAHDVLMCLEGNVWNNVLQFSF